MPQQPQAQLCTDELGLRQPLSCLKFLCFSCIVHDFAASLFYECTAQGCNLCSIELLNCKIPASQKLRVLRMEELAHLQLRGQCGHAVSEPSQLSSLHL